MPRLVLLLLSALALLSCRRPPPPADAVPTNPAGYADYFRGQLRRLDPASGELVAARLEPGVTRVGFYFGAHWCPPCRTLVPRLARWYRQHHRPDSDWDLIYVSADTSAEALAESVAKAKMPWLVLDYDTARTSPALDPIRPAGYPATALVDDATGRVITHSIGDDGQYRGAAVVTTALGLPLEDGARP